MRGILKISLKFIIFINFGVLMIKIKMSILQLFFSKDLYKKIQKYKILKFLRTI